MNFAEQLGETRNVLVLWHFSSNTNCSCVTVLEYRVVSLLDYYICAKKDGFSTKSCIDFVRSYRGFDRRDSPDKQVVKSRETKNDEEAERQVGERREVFRLDTESNCCIQKASARTSSSTRHPAGSGHREIEDRRLFIFIWAAI